ncbi:hypothetical protein NDU88_008052 [Pleurodeles waltl]|uniref:Uncharacterized protein n=1 Tax=Pleurodeles waltl TaxID=8319 RepID=A0AAV7NZP2_PLEWA|nr:hypothetical protein NDU88_008052 [Pleurodeles waltl]
MGQAWPACWGHQLATTRHHEQPGPQSPLLQALTTPSSLAGPTISPPGPSRLHPDAAGALLGLRRAPQAQPGSTTGPQEARTGRSPTPHSLPPPGVLRTSPGSSARRKAALQGRPGSGTRTPPRAPHHSARPRHLSARTSRPDPRGRGPAPPRATAEGRLPAPTGPKAARATIRLPAGQHSSSVPSSGDG